MPRAGQRVTAVLPFSLCNKKTCNSAHEQTPLSNDTIDSVLRIGEVGRAKDLSAPPLIVECVGTRVGLDGCGKSQPNGIRSPDRQPRSQSLYPLPYPVPIHPSLYKRNLSLAVQSSSGDSASASVLRYVLAWRSSQIVCQQKWKSGA